MENLISFDTKEWFFETTFPGIRRCKRDGFRIEEEIYRGKTQFQDIYIFKSLGFGTIMTLDGIVQLSQCDEFIYHEMIVHVPLLSHRNAERVLIIGGGDGGTLREIAKHPVKEIVMVDLDKEVVDISKKYLPFVSAGSFSDKRLKLYFEDGIKFIGTYSDYFDVIIVDCTDPIGPGKVLFGMDFYKRLFAALKKDGIAMFQLGPFLDFDLFVEDSAKKLKKLFSSIHPVRLPMPSYSCGSEYCFMAASKQTDLKKIKAPLIDKRLNARLGRNVKTLKYFTPEVYTASLVMPRLWQL